MRINLTGTHHMVYSTLQAMVSNDIPFTRFIRYRDGLIISMGSRKVLSIWDKNKFDLVGRLHSILVRDRDLDLIILLSTAEVTS